MTSKCSQSTKDLEKKQNRSMQLSPIFRVANEFSIHMHNRSVTYYLEYIVFRTLICSEFYVVMSR